MGGLAIIRNFRRVEELNLEEGLAVLCKYGYPGLRKFDNGWYCSLDMFVTGEGIEFKIASGFKQPSPLEAVRVCCERLEKTLKDLGAK